MDTYIKHSTILLLAKCCIKDDESFSYWLGMTLLSGTHFSLSNSLHGFLYKIYLKIENFIGKLYMPTNFNDMNAPHNTLRVPLKFYKNARKIHTR